MRNGLFLLFGLWLVLIPENSCLSITQEPRFDSGMRTDTKYMRSCRKYRSGWKLMRRRFEQYRKARAKTRFRKACYKIPKKIHMIWLGSKPPLFVWKMLDSWKWCHPTWSIKLWTDKDVHAFPLKNRQAYERAKNWGKNPTFFDTSFWKKREESTLMPILSA